MKKQSSRARAQSTPPVRHQLDHVVPTVIHDPEEGMTTLGRWVHHALRDPRRYLGWPAAIVVGVILVAVVWNLSAGRSSSESDVWSKLDTAKTAAERVDVAKANPQSPAATWALLQAATEYFNQALADLPNNRDVALPTSRKALDLFEEVVRDAPHDSPQARAAALGKARVLEMRNELPKAIEQYELVTNDKDWAGSPEAEQARRYADALKDPQAAAFYKELYAYSPTKVTLPPFGTETLPPPGSVPMPAPSASPKTSPSPASNARSDQPPPLAPGLDIPGLRDVIDPATGRTIQLAQPKTGTPAAKPDAAKPAGAQKDLPADVFAPKPKESK
jgi:tetratricopeptide (TPR) repeat protein